MNGLLRWNEVCALLSISRRSLYNLEKKGRLPALKLGPKSYRWRADLVQSFIETAGR
jgi:excisionase family DNA binding protein